MRYDFEWDPKKAKINQGKHTISFERATTIFRDPNILSIPDVEHSQDKERWVTIGADELGVLLVVSHTFSSINRARKIRIISARKAAKAEVKTYEEGI